MTYIPDMTERYPEGIRQYWESDDWDDWDTPSRSKKPMTMTIHGVTFQYSQNGPFILKLTNGAFNNEEYWRCKTLAEARKFAVLMFTRNDHLGHKSYFYIYNKKYPSRYYLAVKYILPNGKTRALYSVYDGEKTIRDWHYLYPKTGEVGPKIGSAKK